MKISRQILLFYRFKAQRAQGILPSCKCFNSTLENATFFVHSGSSSVIIRPQTAHSPMWSPGTLHHPGIPQEKNCSSSPSSSCFSRAARISPGGSSRGILCLWQMPRKGFLVCLMSDPRRKEKKMHKKLGGKKRQTLPKD